MRKWTQRAEKKYGWTYGGLYIYIHDTWKYLATRNGVDNADKMIAPLEWWIKTGRASLAECKALVEKKPYIIGRILAENPTGNYDDILAAIKKKIGM